MEQARYWMCTKGKDSWRSHFAASGNSSWEEEAFAKDASQPLGAFIWPPRSYSCSFCRREFKTAQALGGHMNVHRRDRARLKLSPSPHNEISCKYIGVADDSDQIYTSACNPNPNSNDRVVASLLPPPRVSAPSTQVNTDKMSMISPIQEHKGSFSFPRQSWSNSVSIRVCSNSDSKKRGENPMKQKSAVHDHDGNSSKPDLSKSLNLVTHPGKQSTFSCKRRRTDEIPLPFFHKRNSSTRHHLQSQIIERSLDTADDLDLELRLGDPPKVK